MMRWTLVPLLALLLVPIAAAAPTGAQVDEETDTMQQAIDGIHVQEETQFHPVAAAQYQANAAWGFLIQHSAKGVVVHVSRGGQEQTVDGSRINRTASATSSTYDDLKVNLTGLYSSIVSTDKFVLRVNYDLQDAYDHTLTSSPTTLVVYAQPRDGFEARSAALEFIATGNGTETHAALQNPANGFHFAAAFERSQSTSVATSSGPRDLTPYLWAIGGLAIGFLFALFLARRGVFAPAPKKFEKGGQMESRSMLEARRRTLMAALKDLELGHEAKEIPDAAYAPLKEEYKAQAVKAMRNLEEKDQTPKP